MQMSYKKITVNPNGSAIQLNLTFTGTNTLISYRWNLWETRGNGKYYPSSKVGTNQNPYDDSFTLPLPVAENVGRMVVIDYGVILIDPNVDSKNWSVSAEIVQDGASKGFVTDNGSLEGNSLSSSIYISLI